MAVSKPGGALNKVEFSEQMLNLLYTFGFRLTGDHREAARLVEEAVNRIHHFILFDKSQGGNYLAKRAQIYCE